MTYLRLIKNHSVEANFNCAIRWSGPFWGEAGSKLSCSEEGAVSLELPLGDGGSGGRDGCSGARFAKVADCCGNSACSPPATAALFWLGSFRGEADSKPSCPGEGAVGLELALGDGNSGEEGVCSGVLFD